MITNIKIVETIHTMGETSETDAERFVEYLSNELALEYPNAEISVELNNRISSTQICVECDLDEDGCPTEIDGEEIVQEFINRVWENWC